ncbi:MAG: hypothetical protein WCY54_04255, partial [Syntrophales bacterium]
ENLFCHFERSEKSSFAVKATLRLSRQALGVGRQGIGIGYRVFYLRRTLRLTLYASRFLNFGFIWVS